MNLAIEALRAIPKKTPVVQSRQVLRREIFLRNWHRVQSIDFQGEPVALRDTAGTPVIRRRSRQWARDIARRAARRDWHTLRQKRQEDNQHE